MREREIKKIPGIYIGPPQPGKKPKRIMLPRCPSPTPMRFVRVVSQIFTTLPGAVARRVASAFNAQGPPPFRKDIGQETKGTHDGVIRLQERMELLEPFSEKILIQLENIQKQLRTTSGVKP